MTAGPAGTTAADTGPAALLSRLRAGRVMLWDGGLGTSLIARGLVLATEPPEAWLLTRAAEVQAVHAGFAEAGSDVVQTDSFGLLRLWLSGWTGPAGAPLRPEQEADYLGLARRSVELARAGADAGARAAETADVPRFVVASLGPTGAADVGRVEAAVTALTEAFAAAGAAALHLETCYAPAELRAAVAGARAASPALPLFVSVTVSMGQSGLETPLGTPLLRVLKELEREPPDLIGVNCSLTARRMLPAVAALREWAGARLPVLAQPQVGQPAPDCKRPAVPETPERFASDLLALIHEGADAVGGCCGCTADHLRAVRQRLA